MAEIITKDSEEFKELTGWMKKDRKIGGGGDGKDTSRHRGRTLPAGGRRVRNAAHLKRTLQTLRDEGAIPYTTIGGKILYPESALYETLRKNYRNYRQYAG